MSVGVCDGTSVGVAEGDDDGGRLGVKVGTLLGAAEGDDEGLSLGVKVGSLVGVAVVGTAVGAVVSVGPFVGLVEGASEQKNDCEKKKRA